MQTIYIEKEILHHARTQRIIRQLKPSNVILCEHYKEVFNPKSQNFRIQKQNPALILAKKNGTKIFPSPEGFGIGGQQNFYFSHILNCLYDCRYCFLQGMYSSANYVVFINYEDFMEEITSIAKEATSPVYFFSGYDGDSLAYEPVTDFVKEFLPFFEPLKNAFLELRTKSTNVKNLMNHRPFAHCIVAFSFTPDTISRTVEHKVPLVAKRLRAMQDVAEKGWPIGLRLDPLIYHPNFKLIYEELIESIFSHIQAKHIHSISIGPMRFPDNMYQKIIKLYPTDPLLAHPLHKQGKIFSYQPELEHTMKQCVYEILKKHVNQTLLFECKV